jgi:hypothetical protein
VIYRLTGNKEVIYLDVYQPFGKWQAVAFERDLKAAMCTRCRLFVQVTTSAFSVTNRGTKQPAGILMFINQ